MNRVATTCMIAVPFMLMVIPSGSTKEAIFSSTPSSSVVVFTLSGRAAALEEVENPNTATRKIFFANFTGFCFVVAATKIGYPTKRNKRSRITVTTTYARAGFKWLIPYVANVLARRTKIANGPNFVTT